jgi:hypothetical protein
MKILKIISCFTFCFSIILVSILYQSCKPIRNCNVLNDIYGSYFNRSTDSTLSDSSSVKATEFGIAVAFRQNSYQCKNESNFSFISKAYAYKPSIQYYNLDTIKSISITSNQDFDASHAAGALLNDCFIIPDLDSINISNAYFDNAFGFNLLLKKMPSAEKYHQFTVKATVQSSNKVLTYTYGVIEILQ